MHIAVAIETMAIIAAVALLPKFGAERYIPQAIGMIVGLHFLGIWVASPTRKILWISAGMCFVSAGSMFVPQPATTNVKAADALTGFGNACILWMASLHDPSVAPVFSHNEVLIHAGCHRAFTHLADATDWPNWFVLVKDVTNETPGNTGQGALYRLKIFSSPIQSRIAEFVPDERISWIPFGADETESRHGYYHAWHFIRGVRIVSHKRRNGYRSWRPQRSKEWQSPDAQNS